VAPLAISTVLVSSLFANSGVIDTATDARTMAQDEEPDVPAVKMVTGGIAVCALVRRLGSFTVPPVESIRRRLR
jgi:hypothetical protein